MLRKLLIVGVCAGTSASIPIIYQSNPEGFQALLEQAVKDEPEPAVPQVSALAPSRPATGQPEMLVGRKVRLAADERGHFSADFKLNGRRVTALVDTGATLVALNASTARRIGIKLEPADFRHTVDTANGKAKAAGVIIETLQLGRIHLTNIEALVLSDEALSNTLIGMSFLKRLGRFQIENGALLLQQ